MILVDNLDIIPTGYIYIYGAGLISELVSREIEKYYNEKLIVKAYTVSKEGTLKRYRKKSVILPNQMEHDKSVIIATLSNSFREIENKLNECGITNIYGISEKLIKKMRSHFVPILHDAGILKIKLNEMRKLSGEEHFVGLAIAPQNEYYNPFPQYISQDDFLKNEYRFENKIYVYGIDWSKDWITFLNKVFDKGTEIVVSFRSRFLDYQGYSVINYAKEKGFTKIKIKKIPRKIEDYPTEDIIIHFAKTAEGLDYDDSVLKHYDVGLVGNWAHTNYGAELTYFALYSQLKKMGKSVLMISWAEDCEWKPYCCTQLFNREPYSIEEIGLPNGTHYDLYNLNDRCDMFIHGSDQVLNPYVYRMMGNNVLMDWVDCDVKRLGYALSFGSENVDFTAREIKDMTTQLSLFDAISVREESGVELMKKLCGIETRQVLDPVFLHNKEFYQDIAKDYICKKDELFVYILDENTTAESIISDFAVTNKMSAYMFSDAEKYEHDGSLVPFDNKKSMERWLAAIISSKYVITDSFHGMCLAIICNKPFAVLCNHRRGATRFVSVLKKLKLEERLCSNISQEILEKVFSEKIDYGRVNEIIAFEREKSINWLTEKMDAKHTSYFSNESQYWYRKYKELEIRMRDRDE